MTLQVYQAGLRPSQAASKVQGAAAARGLPTFNKRCLLPGDLCAKYTSLFVCSISAASGYAWLSAPLSASNLLLIYTTVVINIDPATQNNYLYF